MCLFHNNWSDVEKKAWEDIKKDGIASLNSKELSAKFLNSILFDVKYNQEILQQGIKFEQATFTDEINLEYTEIKHYLCFCKCCFKKKVKLNGFKTKHDLSFEESDFLCNLEMKHSRFEGSLSLNNINCQQTSKNCQAETPHSEADISYSQIDDCLELKKARFSKLTMEHVTILADLLMNEMKCGNEKNKKNDDCPEVLNLNNSRIEGKMVLTRAQIFGYASLMHIDIRKDAFFGEFKEDSNKTIVYKISLVAARADCTFIFNNLHCRGKAKMESLWAGVNVFMRYSRFEGDVDLRFARAKVGFYLEAKYENNVDLTGAHIGELILSEDDTNKRANWPNTKSKLFLSNGNITSLRSLVPENWPQNLELDGLSYSRICFEDKEFMKKPPEEAAESYLRWLRLDEQSSGGGSPFNSPQPYKQLGDVLRKIGRIEESELVGLEAKKIERRRSKWWWQKIVMLFLEWTIGYGYKYRLCILWILPLFIMGTFVASWSNLHCSCFQCPAPTICIKQYCYCFNIRDLLISFTWLIPVINFNGIIAPPELLYNWQVLYFYFHRIMGTMLAGAAVAGLTGLTRR